MRPVVRAGCLARGAAGSLAGGDTDADIDGDIDGDPEVDTELEGDAGGASGAATGSTGSAEPAGFAGPVGLLTAALAGAGFFLAIARDYQRKRSPMRAGKPDCSRSPADPVSRVPRSPRSR